jgi:hypothetical protein
MGALGIIDQQKGTVRFSAAVVLWHQIQEQTLCRRFLIR